MKELLNRKAFFEAVSQTLDKDTGRDFVLVYFDIYRFKMINDLFGIKEGDRILNIVSDEIISEIGENGICSWLGADHFMVLLPDENADPEEMLVKVKQSTKNIDIEYDIEIYMGFYRIVERSLPVSIMCDRAKMAMQTVKGSCIKYYSYYEGLLREKVIAEQTLLRDAKMGLKNGEFFFELQPIWSVSEDRPVSAEALVRWDHPTRGVLYPEEFIPLFEENGYITRLDEYIWEEVCKFLHSADEKGQRMVPVSLNISRRNFYSPDLPRMLMDLTEKYHIDPAMIKLEIVERIYTEDPETMLSIVRHLQLHGFQIMMDDFGSGYSSLNMIKDIPINVLKLDKRLIDEIETSGRLRSMLSNIIRLCRWLEMTVIAEGVETKPQLDYLGSIGCDMIQGYYYSKAVSVDGFLPLVRSCDAKAKSVTEPAAGILEEANVDSLIDKMNKVDDAMSDLIGGIALYEYVDGNLEVIRVNNAYYRITGSSPKTIFKDNKNELAWLYEDDRGKFTAACLEAADSGETRSVIVRRYHQNGRLILLQIKVKCRGILGNGKIFYACINEIKGDTVGKGKENSGSGDMLGSMHHSDLKPEIADTAKDGIEPDGRRKKVLIVDDSIVNRKIIGKILSDDYDLLEAENGKKALEIIAEEDYRIDAILLDIIMPVMSGMEFLEARKKDSGLNAIPVIVLTQAETREDEQKALGLGASDFLRKPYEPDTIKQRLTNLMDLSDAVSRKASIEAIINNLPGGVLCFEMEGAAAVPRYISEGLSLLSGYTNDEFMEKFGRDMLENVYLDDRKRIRDALTSIRNKENESVEMEYRSFHRNGGMIWILLQARFAYMRNGDPVYYAVLTDISKLKDSEHELKKSHMKYKMAVDAAGSEILEYNIKKNTMLLPEKTAESFGVKPFVDDSAEIFKKSEVISKKEYEKIMHGFDALQRGESPVNYILTLAYPDGKTVHKSITYIIVPEENGMAEIAIGTANDVTDNIETYNKYKGIVNYRKLITKNSLLALQFDLETGSRIKTETDVLPSACAGKCSGNLFECMDLFIHKYVYEEDRFSLYELVGDKDSMRGKLRENGEISCECRVSFRGSDSEKADYRWCSLSIETATDEKTKSSNVMIVLRDIHKIKMSQMELYEKAHHDSLTGLFDRETFRELVEQRLQMEAEGNHQSAFMIMDIDDFKDINDTYGHSCGDEVLRHIGQRLKSIFRTEDYIARLGGDEIVMYMMDVSNEQVASKKGNEVCAVVSGWRNKNKTLNVACSVGIAMAKGGIRTYEELYNNADKALYEAKRSGKNRCCMYKE
ncbi:MAG: EAL domain-containing protein [Eubacteriaceae bacterium]|nr:EAL domain-containing protein [Eubacteriaceae bacterium]